MGWCSDDGTHEGYLVGLVPDEEHGLFLGHVQGRWRELGSRDVEQVRGLRFLPSGAIHLQYVKVGCSCGWRSPLLFAPAGCEFAPSTVAAPEWFEEACTQLWTRHVAAAGRAPDGGFDIKTLVERVRASDH